MRRVAKPFKRRGDRPPRGTRPGVVVPTLGRAGSLLFLPPKLHQVTALALVGPRLRTRRERGREHVLLLELRAPRDAGARFFVAARGFGCRPTPRRERKH